MLEHNPTVAHPEAGVFVAESHLRDLERRLERGWQMIETEEARGASTERLMAHFLNLLSEYETACDSVKAA